jgi:hypothetical protein
MYENRRDVNWIPYQGYWYCLKWVVHWDVLFSTTHDSVLCNLKVQFPQHAADWWGQVHLQLLHIQDEWHVLQWPATAMYSSDGSWISNATVCMSFADLPSFMCTVQTFAGLPSFLFIQLEKACGVNVEWRGFTVRNTMIYRTTYWTNEKPETMI